MYRILILLFCFSVALSAVADEGDDQVLSDLLTEFLQGASSNDVAMHDRFWSETLVYTSSGGSRFGKEVIMTGLRQGQEQPTEGSSRYWAEDTDIRLYGDTAVVAFRLMAEVKPGDEEATELMQYFNTGTFLREEGVWRAVAWQATRITEPDES